MKRCPFLLLLTWACLTFLVAGALNRGSCPSAFCDTQSLPASSDLPYGAELLKQACASLGPSKVAWLETTVWQQFQDADSRFVARGRYYLAPGQRQRLELQVRVGKTDGKIVLVSDGRTLCQLMRVGQAAPVVLQHSLGPAETSPGEKLTPQSQLLNDLGTGGIDRLLESLQKNLSGVRVAKASWKGQIVFRIEGDWQPSPSMATAANPGINQTAPQRRCAIFLDAHTLWPHRIEWSVGDGRENSQVEFREPLLNQPLPTIRADRLFSIPLGNEIEAVLR
jgi:hypothetical protein